MREGEEGRGEGRGGEERRGEEREERRGEERRGEERRGEERRGEERRGEERRERPMGYPERLGGSVMLCSAHHGSGGFPAPVASFLYRCPPKGAAAPRGGGPAPELDSFLSTTSNHPIVPGNTIRSRRAPQRKRSSDFCNGEAEGYQQPIAA